MAEGKLIVNIKLDNETKKTIEKLGSDLNTMGKNYENVARLLGNNKNLMESIISKLKLFLEGSFRNV